MASWIIMLRGGPFDGFEGSTWVEPEPVLVAWACPFRGCEGHATFDATEPQIVLRTAESYQRTEVDRDRRVAIYELGDGVPGSGVEDEHRELVGAAFWLGDGWHASPLETL